MEEIQELAKIFKALSDPNRLKIIKFLSEKNGYLCVNALCNKLKLSQSAVSQHLRVLRNMSIVESNKEGLNVYYKINEESISKFKRLITDNLGYKFIG
jgi:DNA-binding transcriptional ArsR family regulator